MLSCLIRNKEDYEQWFYFLLRREKNESFRFGKFWLSWQAVVWSNEIHVQLG